MGSEPGFFHVGVTAAGLKTVGTTGVVSEEWMIAEMKVRREERGALTKSVEKGSS